MAARLRLVPTGPGHAADLWRLRQDEAVTDQIASALPGDGWLRGRLELGWAVRSELWGQGYATEIGQAGRP